MGEYPRTRNVPLKCHSFASVYTYRKNKAVLSYLNWVNFTGYVLLFMFLKIYRVVQYTPSDTIQKVHLISDTKRVRKRNIARPSLMAETCLHLQVSDPYRLHE